VNLKKFSIQQSKLHIVASLFASFFIHCGLCPQLLASKWTFKSLPQPFGLFALPTFPHLTQILQLNLKSTNTKGGDFSAVCAPLHSPNSAPLSFNQKSLFPLPPFWLSPLLPLAHCTIGYIAIAQQQIHRCVHLLEDPFLKKMGKGGRKE
jgi:hypothetical protein